ncbi:hypothetical protein GCM10010282_37550 [Streptomyces roseolus]|nr:hypothetical protein GCM10010282_37550 [Streptomyces roseolus]
MNGVLSTCVVREAVALGWAFDDLVWALDAGAAACEGGVTARVTAARTAKERAHTHVVGAEQHAPGGRRSDRDDTKEHLVTKEHPPGRNPM